VTPGSPWRMNSPNGRTDGAPASDNIQADIGHQGGNGMMISSTDLRSDPRSEVDEDARVKALEDLGVVYTQPEERFDRITRLARLLFGVPAAAVTLIDRDSQYIKSLDGAPVCGSNRDDAFCDETIGQAETLVVPDAALDPRFASKKSTIDDGPIRFYAGHPLTAPGGHRVGALCLLGGQPRTFSATEEALLAELAEWVQDELTRSTELRHAAEAQRALIPRTAPVVPGFQIAGACLPSRGVGGDFIDWYHLPGGDLAVTLGDVMGKGMAAAIMMASVRSAMRAVGRTAGPADAVGEVAVTLADDLEANFTLITLCHAHLMPDEGRVRFVDAGHGLVLLVGADGRVERPSGGGLPLGVRVDGRWEEQEMRLAPGDTLVMFSDGLLDLYDDPGASLDRIAEMVRSSTHARQIVDRVVQRARQIDLLDDDVTVVAIRRSA
jgi:hypothetical protein